MALSLPRAEGVLHIKGTLSQKAETKKFESYFFKLEDCVLSFYIYNWNEHQTKEKDKDKKKVSTKDPTPHPPLPPVTEMGQLDHLIDVLPLTYFVLEDLHEAGKKSDKPQTNFAFVLTNEQNKKWRTVFCTDTEEELKNWKKALESSIYLTRAAYFDTNVSDACLKSNKYIPDIVSQCIEIIDKNVKVEGLFRVPGDKSLITEVKEHTDKGIIPSFAGGDIHLVCGVLKNYLRELREPLVPVNLYRQAIEAQAPHQIKALVDMLPLANRTLLCTLMRFLNRVEKESQFNLMDVSNLATVFGPTIIRNLQDDGPNSLQNMALSNQVIKVMIQNTLPISPCPIFTYEDVERANHNVINYETEIAHVKLSMNTEERKAIEQVLLPHHSAWLGTAENVWHNTISFVVNTFNAKSETFEPHILVCDLNRVYVFARGGKLEFQFHMLDLEEIDSPSKSQMTLIWNEGGKMLSLRIHPVSYASFDMDAIIDWIHSNWELNFVGVPEAEKFSLKILPTARSQALLSRFVLENKLNGCGGLVRTYISVSDWQNTPVQEDIIWDLENYFYPNNLTVFNLYDILHKDKFPNPEFQAIAYSLRYNIWFKELNCIYCSLKDESTATLAEIFKTNTTLEVLSLVNAGAERNGILVLCESFDSNPNNGLTSLDLSGNYFDSRVTQAFSKSLGDSLGKLKHLNLSNCQIKKMPQIFDSIGSKISLVNGLTHLNISSNKMDVESSTKLGTVLFLSHALKSLAFSGTSPTWAAIVEGIRNKTNNSITSLDISHNPTRAKNLGEISALCKMLPSLEILNIADTGISSEVMAEILTACPKISELDLSENEFADETICDFLKQNLGVLTELKKLSWNKSFRVSKIRAIVMKTLAKAITTAGIKELYIKECKLKQDSVELVSNLHTNNSLLVLDISANSGGDELAVSLSKLLAVNRSLQKIYVDNNETSITGLRALRLGLSRNPIVEHVPLPVMDIDTLLKKQDEDVNGILKVSEELQKILFEKSQQKKHQLAQTLVTTRLSVDANYNSEVSPFFVPTTPSSVSPEEIPPPTPTSMQSPTQPSSSPAAGNSNNVKCTTSNTTAPDSVRQKRKSTRNLAAVKGEKSRGTPRSPHSHNHTNSDDTKSVEDETSSDITETSETESATEEGTPQGSAYHRNSTKQKKKLPKKKVRAPPSYAEASEATTQQHQEQANKSS